MVNIYVVVGNWTTFLYTPMAFFLSASDNLGHCHRRCLGSPQPQQTFPGFVTFASADCSADLLAPASLLFANDFEFALVSAFNSRISSSFIMLYEVFNLVRSFRFGRVIRHRARPLVFADLEGALSNIPDD